MNIFYTMKHILIIALTVIYLNSFSQENVLDPPKLWKDQVTNKFSTEGIVRIDSIPAEQLLEGTYKWLSEIKYVNSVASKGIILDEAVFNRITVSQYYIASKATFNTKVRFMWSLEFRDGRFRYRFTDFSYLAVTSRKDFEDVKTFADQEFLQKLLVETDTYIKSSLTELRDYLLKYEPDRSW